MFKQIGLIGSTVALCGCGIFPGMENLKTTKVKKYTGPQRLRVSPTLIPITPTLIADQHISKYYYRVAPSDVLSVTVWQHPEFKMGSSNLSAMTEAADGGGAGMGDLGFLVNADGYIFFPMLGDILVSGKTVEEIRIDIARKLVKYVPDPQVLVRVSEYRSRKVYVLGEVAKTGFLPLNDQPLTLADALAMSGWLNADSANPRAIYVIRGEYTQPNIFWLDAKTPDRLLLAERFSLQPQDILYVSSAPIVSVNRTLAQLLPVVQTIWFTKSIIDG